MISQNTVTDKLQYLLKVPFSYSLLSEEKVISHARETLADSVTPYRWEDTQLEEFVSDGIRELKVLRSDLRESDNEHIPDAFESAIANYTVYRALALDNDAQNNNGALSDKYFNLFNAQAAAVPFLFTVDELEKFTQEAVTDLIARRPELRITADNTLKENIYLDGTGRYDLPERFADAICFFAAYRAAVHSKNEIANYFLEQYQGALNTI
jgi:hypothetical protein